MKLRQLFRFLSATVIAIAAYAPQEAAAQTDEQIDLELIEEIDTIIRLRPFAPLEAYHLRQAVFDRYDIADTLSLAIPRAVDFGFPSEAFTWLDDANFHDALVRSTRQRYMIANPALVAYNERLLPEPPRQFHVVVDPASAKLMFVLDSIYTLPVDAPEMDVKIDKRHWLHDFLARLQFSQAYLSPNWYQGGNNALTMMLNLGYHVKLNQKFHPKLLAEMDVTYKLATTGTPEDSLHSINIAEDLFQFNGKFGFKAYNKWWYTINGTFKTQFFKNYEINSPTLRAAFLSPAELNMGVGMTYATTNKRETFSFNASISPFSWNMKTCINPAMNVTDYGIKPGRKTGHEFGSSAEAKLLWKMAKNVSWTSRLFVFTDYSYLQGDWENTFSFDINRFLSTQLYLHLRYDSSTPRIATTRWHTWQLKEILSFGFSYTFATV